MRKLLFLATILALPAMASAQVNRAGSWEWGVIGIYQDSASSGGSQGSSVDVDNAWGLGFNFGYHFNERFMLGVDLEWLRPDYTAFVVSDEDPTDVIRVDHEFDQFNGRLKGTYHFMDGPLTPYVELGLGWTYFDSNVIDGPPSTGCWWHPWWGYVCSNFYSTFTSTDFTYGGALGLRYRLKGGMLLKFSVNHYIIDAGTDKADPELNAARLELAWGF